MAKQKFALNISEFDLDKVGVNLSVGEPDEGRGSESSLKMTATQLSVLAKALGAKKSDVQIITGLTGGEQSESTEDVETDGETSECAGDERPADETETIDTDAAIEDAVEASDADDVEPADESDPDDVATDEDPEIAEAEDDEPVNAQGEDDEGRDPEFDNDGDEEEYDEDDAYPEEDYAEDAEDAEEEFAAAAGYKGDRNSDIFDDPDIDLNDLQDLEERYLAARLRDGEGPAPSTSGLLGGLRQSLESALNMGSDSDEPRPKIRRGSKNPIVRDLIRRHIRNRGWE